LRGHGRYGRTEWILGVAQVILLAVVFLIPYAIPLTAQALSTSASADSGEWSAEVDFGEFNLTVNPEATGISRIVFNFSDFKCGGAAISSGQVSVESFWPIKDDQFTVDVNLGVYKIVIHGRIEEAGSCAAGEWEINSIGAICKGAWKSI
jgi:hypothetical protein